MSEGSNPFGLSTPAQYEKTREGCFKCTKAFGIFTRKVNCVRCGHLMCKACCDAEVDLDMGSMQKVCIDCFSIILDAKQKIRKAQMSPGVDRGSSQLSDTTRDLDDTASNYASIPTASSPIPPLAVRTGPQSPSPVPPPSLPAEISTPPPPQDGSSPPTSPRLQVDYLKGQLAALMQRTSELSVENVKWTARASELEEQLKVATEERDSIRHFNGDEIQHLENAQAALEEERIELSNQKVALAANNAAVTTQRADLEAAQQKLAAEKDVLEAQRAELEARNKQEEAQLAAIQSDAEAVLKANQVLEDRRAQIDADKQGEADLSTIQSEAEAALKANQAELEAAQQQLAAEKAALEAHRAELEAREKQGEADLSTIQSEAEAALKANQAELEATKQQLAAEKAALEAHRAELEAREKQGEAELETTQSDAEARLKAKRAEAEQELAAEKAALDTSREGDRSVSAKVERDRKVLERERRDFEAERERLMASCRELEAKSNTAVRECELTVKEKMDELEKGRRKLESDRIKMARDLRDREAAVEELKEQLEKERKMTREQRRSFKQELEAAAEERDKAAQEWLEMEKERLADREKHIQDAEGRFQRSFVMTGSEADDVGAAGQDGEGGDSSSMLVTPKARVWGGESRVAAMSAIFPDIGAFPVPATEELPYHASDLSSWSIDPFIVAREIQSPLQAMALECVKQWGLGEVIGVEPFRRFVAAVEASYFNNPYHNAIHAADVLQSTFSLVSHCPLLLSSMTGAEKVGVLVSAICHDVCHPGRSNAFLAAIHDPVAIRFGNQSILEHYSIAATFDILKNKRCDFVSGLGRDGFTEFRDLVCALILDTDMSKTVQHLKEMEGSLKGYKEECSRASRARTALPPPFYASPANRRKVLSTLMHAADISGSTKPVTIAKKWAAGVLREMKEESEEVVANGVQGVRTMGEDIPRGQLFFIDTFVAPLFHLVVGDIIEIPMTTVLPIVETTVGEDGRTICPPHLQDPLRCLANVRALWAKQAGVPLALPPRVQAVPTPESKVEVLESQLFELKDSISRRKVDLDRREHQLQRRFQDVEKLEEEGHRINEEQRMLAESKQRMAEALRLLKTKEDALQRAVEIHHRGQIDRLAEEKRRHHIVSVELHETGEDGYIPTDREVEIRRLERIVAERERKCREVQAELLAKERKLIARDEDLSVMESELQGLLHQAGGDRSLVQEILQREVSVARRERDAEKLAAHLGHFATRESAAHELEDRFLIRTYENNVRARESREMLVSATHTKDTVCKRWEHYDKYMLQDDAIQSSIDALREGRASYIKGNYARRQEKERASSNSPKATRSRPLKLPPQSSISAATATAGQAAADGIVAEHSDSKPSEQAVSSSSSEEYHRMPLPPQAAGFHIDGDLDELEHKIYALTHCISMLATH